MKFKPFTERYVHDPQILMREIPGYLTEPLKDWIKDVLWDVEARSSEMMEDWFVSKVSIVFRETFPRLSVGNFLNFVFNDDERVVNFLAFLLQNFAREEQASSLEEILADGGSAFAVMLTTQKASLEHQGIADLVERVSRVTLKAAQPSLDRESLLSEAWSACYSLNPDYDKVVTRCVDFLEGKLKDTCFPKAEKTNLKNFIKNIAQNPPTLVFKGDNLVSPRSLITDVATEFQSVRGQHTRGTGRSATKEEAELVLHYSIFLDNILR